MEPHADLAGDKRSMPRSAFPMNLYDALEVLPEGMTGEILGGQLYTQPKPAAGHVVAASRLGRLLGNVYDLGAGRPHSWWILDELELHLIRDREVLVPDLAGWRRERMPKLPEDQRFEVVPDWVCEILSPSTRSKDREIKMPLYARYGVSHAWLLDPKAVALEIYELKSGEWREVNRYGIKDTVSAAPFEGAVFRLAQLWE